MRILAWLGILVGGIVAVPVVVSIVARFSDGPIGIVAGGPLESGELVEGPEPDWAFARDIDTIEFQLLTPPRSRTTWILEHGGRIYIPCGYLDSAFGRLWKRWPYEAEADGRAIARIDGKRYERQLVRVRNPALFADLTKELERKYGSPATGATPDSDRLWIFELAPRTR